MLFRSGDASFSIIGVSFFGQVIDSKTLVQFIYTDSAKTVNLVFTQKTSLISDTAIKVSVICDGLNAISNSFVLKIIPQPVFAESSKCFCKKTVLTESDVRNIVVGLRKGEVLGKAPKEGRSLKDNYGNIQYFDKKGGLIPNDSKGNPTLKGGEKRFEDWTKYNDLDSKKLEIADRLFFLNDSAENINLSERNYTNLTKWVNFAISQLSLNTCVRKIHFLAQIYHETQRFGNSYENNETAQYHGGNFYQGRGFIQITNIENYQGYYQSLFNKLPNDSQIKSFVPTLASSMETAIKSTVWYWKKENINKYADLDDVERVSAAVNFPARLNSAIFSSTGINGLEDRRRFCNNLKNIFDYENCK